MNDAPSDYQTESNVPPKVPRLIAMENQIQIGNSKSVSKGSKNNLDNQIMAESAEAKVKQVLQSQMSRLDFVSREEFDIHQEAFEHIEV
jgi:BMFP domain-containing protein YqiC